MHPAAADLILRWPADRPLAVVCDGVGPAAHTILAEPDRTIRIPEGFFCGQWLDPRSGEIVGALAASSADPLSIFDAFLHDLGPGSAGGWIGFISYDLGRLIEPTVEASPLARPHAVADREWPLAAFHRYTRGIVVDDATGAAAAFGGPDLPFPGGPDAGYELGPLTGPGPETYEAAVRRALEYIRAGDIFQVNLAHRLTAEFRGSARAAFADLARAARPWHGAYLEFPSPDTAAALLSLSPELFLEIDGGTITTRPMKGTRPADADPRELDESEKDRAELNMIIDLMRNDLGRIAALRSVRVTAPRTIERHQSGVLQATGTVSAVLREGVRWSDILRATFPPGSVTGAPKIRAMQIIDELEPVRRGPYCGAIVHLPDTGPARLSVAIRTAAILGQPHSPGLFTRARLDYSAGAGIVAESRPESEWLETRAKARILDVLSASPAPAPASRPPSGGPVAAALP